MSYDPIEKTQSNDSEIFALKGLTLQLEKGKKYAIVGRTGKIIVFLQQNIDSLLFLIINLVVY